MIPKSGYRFSDKDMRKIKESSEASPQTNEACEDVAPVAGS